MLVISEATLGTAYVTCFLDEKLFVGWSGQATPLHPLTCECEMMCCCYRYSEVINIGQLILFLYKFLVVKRLQINTGWQSIVCGFHLKFIRWKYEWSFELFHQLSFI